MAKKHFPSRRPSVLVPILLVLFLPIMLVGGTLGVLVALGIDLPFIASVEPPSLRIPSNPRPLPAYSKVSRNDLVDFETGQIHYIKMPPASAIGNKVKGTTLAGEVAEGRVIGVQNKEIQGSTYPVLILENQQEVPLPNVDEVGGAMLRLGGIIGRVLDREKSANFGFTASNFLPEGTRPGTAGGVPNGMKAYTLEASQLKGVYGLKIGDKIDLLASVPVSKLSPGGALAEKSGLPPGLNAKRSGRDADEQFESRLIASDSQVIAPVYRRTQAGTTNSLVDGARAVATPIEEVVLAVHEEDVPALTEVLALGISMMAVAHSGRPVDALQEVPEGMVRVPINPRETIPYTQIRKPHLIPSGAGEVKSILLSQEQVDQLQILTQPELIVGRVVRRAKGPGAFFTEDDFYPIGTAPGISAAVPPGKVAYTIDASKIGGIAGLTLGDPFDLIATQAVDYEKIAQNVGSGDYVISSAIRRGALRLDQDAHSRVILRGAIVIAPPNSAALNAHGTVVSDSREKQSPMVIALSPNEVPPLTQAMSTSAVLTAVMRSSTDQASAPIPDTPNPADSVHVLDSVVGEKRESIVFVTDSSRRPAKPVDLRTLIPESESVEGATP